MANSLDALGHRVTVTNIPGSQFFDTRQNVKKRLETFRFNKTIPDGEINISYAATVPINADVNLFISDKSTAINENSPNFLIEETSFIGLTFNIFFKNFLLTDVFTAETITRPSEPLYFKHTLSPEVDENSVVILDKNFNPVDGNLYVIEKPLDFNNDDGLPMDGSDVDHPLVYQGVFVYNNLANSYDPDIGEFIVYYVGYADNNGNNVHELLNNVTVFHQAEFEDIFQLTSALKPWIKAYQISENNGVFTITTPLAKIYSVKTLDIARIFVTDPIDKESDLPWFIRVTNGSFKFVDGSETYLYSLPEFIAQNFNPVFPFKIIISEESLRITQNLIKLRRGEIEIDPLNNFNLDLEIFDENDTIVFAITTDPVKTGQSYIDNSGNPTSIIWAGDKIQSIDKLNGFVYLTLQIKDTYKVLSTYFFKEKFYEFTQVNFNPTQNNDILNQRIIIYLVPENINNNNIAHTSSLNYLIVNPNGLIIFTSQDGSGGNDDLKTSKFMIEGADRHSTTPGGLAHVFWVNQDPQHMGMYYDAIPNLAPDAGGSEEDGGISHIFSVFPMPGPSPDTFVDTFTLKAAAGKPGLDTRYLVLAELFVNEHTSPEEVNLLDTRVRGGGIKQDKIDDALLLNPEVQWYNDIGTFDGRPFPGTSVVIIKIPYTILDEFGGLLTRKQVKQIVKKHLALGSEPIIRYYGAIPNFTAIFMQNESVTVNWDSEGSQFGYNLYISNNKEGPYTKVNTSLIVDNPLGNSYVITGLNNKIAYHVTGTAVNLFTDVEGPRAIAIIGRPDLIARFEDGELGHTFTVDI